MRFIGDTHGKFTKYLSLIEAVGHSMQVGDFGAGFNTIPDISSNHRFIRGNHDNPNICKEHPNWIPDLTVIDRMFLLGGGFSLDHHSRIEGKEWWPDEELSHDDLYKGMDIYEASACDIIVSHECPHEIAPLLFNKRRVRVESPSRTSQALSSLLWIRKPTLWIFGHWHISVDEVIDGTRFICLNELEYIDLDI
jgi:predicted phosphodiesterase